LDPEDGGDVPPQLRLTLNGLHGVISQKMILFMTTALKTSNPTEILFVAAFNRDTEDRGSRLLRTVGKLPDYKAFCPRTQYYL
jgi:hypothetical protein